MSSSMRALFHLVRKAGMAVFASTVHFFSNFFTSACVVTHHGKIERKVAQGWQHTLGTRRRRARHSLE